MSVGTAAAPAHSSVPSLLGWARWRELSGIREHSGSPLCWQSHVAESLCRWAAVGDFSYTVTLRRRHLSSLEITYRAFNRAGCSPTSQLPFLPPHLGPTFLVARPYSKRLLGWTLVLDKRRSALWSLPSRMHLGVKSFWVETICWRFLDIHPWSSSPMQSKSMGSACSSWFPCDCTCTCKEL